MACGLPVVGTNIGGIPSQVIDKTTGYLVELNNIEQLKYKILKLTENKELRLQIDRLTVDGHLDEVLLRRCTLSTAMLRAFILAAMALSSVSSDAAVTVPAMDSEASSRKVRVRFMRWPRAWRYSFRTSQPAPWPVGSQRGRG